MSIIWHQNRLWAIPASKGIQRLFWFALICVAVYVIGKMLIDYFDRVRGKPIFVVNVPPAPMPQVDTGQPVRECRGPVGFAPQPKLAQPPESPNAA